MINVNGKINLRLDYDVQLNISQEEFDKLEQFQKDALICQEISWSQPIDHAEIVDIDIKEDEK